MDDDNKERPRKGGYSKASDRAPGKPAGATGRGDGAKRFGKSDKPFAKGGKKPVVKREEGAGGDRPQRGFRPRGGDEAGGRGERPFGKKPFVKREDGAGGDRPQRSFRPRGEGSEGGERTFRKAPRRDGEGFAPRGEGNRRPGRFEREQSEREGGDGRSFRPLREDGDRPARDFKRPARREDGDSRPSRSGDFQKRGPRADGERSERRFDDKPKRFAPRREAEEFEAGERISKRLARAGIASRRDAEELIAAGRIRVNGKVLDTPAYNVLPEDVIHLDETLIPAPERTRLFLFHKPAGVVTTNRDPEGRKTVFDVLPQELPRLMTVGRLDINTEGLLLLTNDGGLSRVLELPATGWLRRYRVRVHGKIEQKTLDGLRDGIAVDGVFYGSVEATLDREQGSNAWITVGLREGKNREVKNIMAALGLDVNRLIRISYGPFQLGELPEGHVLEIKGRMLREQLGDRLVEESGANFEADIAKPFSNKPVKRTEPKDEAEARPARATRGPVEIGEGGLIKNRKRDRERHREDVLGRLSTKPERSGKFGDRKKGDADGKPGDAGAGPRKANVWMAPGARPQGTRNKPVEKRGPGKPPSGGRPRGPRKDKG